MVFGLIFMIEIINWSGNIILIQKFEFINKLFYK
jgi:hypothetical protein